METIRLAAIALEQISSGKLTFADFSLQLKGKEYATLDNSLKRQVRTFVSCALHKSEIARFTLMQNGLDELSPLNQKIVNVYLCNRYFLHIKELTLDDLLTIIEGDHDKELIKNADVITGAVKSLFPPQLDFKTPFALSLRYNLPIPFLERMIEELGFNKTQKFLDKYASIFQVHGRLNLAKTTPEQFFGAHPDFKAVNLKDAFVYIGQAPIKGLPSYKECLYYTMQLSDMAIAEMLVGYGYSEVLLLESEKSSMLIDLAKLNPNAKIDALVTSKHRYHVLSSVLKMFELPNATIQTKDRQQLKESYDLIYLTPSSSNFDQIKAKPDFFINYDPSKDYVTSLTTALHDASLKLKAGGSLVYKVGTFLKAETTEVSKQFLSEHSDFTLVFERQFLPFHKEQTISYYAIFRKNPLNEN